MGGAIGSRTGVARMCAITCTLLAAVAMVSSGCVTVSGPPTVAVACTPAPAATIRTPSDLDWALMVGAGIAEMEPETPAEELETRRFLATLPIVRGMLVDSSLTIHELHLERRRSSSVGERGIPDLVLTALHVEGIQASELAGIGAEYLAWVMLRKVELGILSPDKPSPEQAVVAGRPLQQTLWGDHLLAWFPHGEVLYVVMAADPQLLALAVDALPAPRSPKVEPSHCPT